MYILAIVLFMVSLRADFASDMLDAHNNYRLGLLNGTETRQPQAQTMPMMTWDPTLAAKAQEWADNCVFKHSSDEFRTIPGFDYLGENIAAGTNYADGRKAVHAWYGEIVDYIYETNTCNKKCGHYTQVVWANSVKLGCGTKRCPNFFGTYAADFIVCMYGPGGNWDGEKPYVSVSNANGNNNLSESSTSTTTLAPEPTTTATTTVAIPDPTTTTTKEPSTMTTTTQNPIVKPTIPVIVDNTENMVQIHNRYRQAVLDGTEARLPKAKTMPMLVRDENLHQSAKKIAAKCKFGITARKELYDKRFTVVGSTYAYEATSDETIVESWYRAVSEYNFQANSCSFFCDYFKQIVSAKTTKLGCARNICKDWDYVVCLYGPASDRKARPYVAA